MAERRMFAKSIIDSDIFLDMPLSAQALYFHLSMRADDEGFINNPRKIQRSINANDDDFKVLIANQFVIPFESGIVVIKHWKIHNYIQKDRFKSTLRYTEKSQLRLGDNGVYELVYPECIQNGHTLDTQVRLVKDSIVKDSIGDILPGAANADTGPTDPAVVNLMLNDKSLYPVTQSQIDHWSELYPSVDIKQELLKMQGWLESNPSRRKTKRGINTFITNWLSREQDEGKTVQNQYFNSGQKQRIIPETNNPFLKMLMERERENDNE